MTWRRSSAVSWTERWSTKEAAHEGRRCTTRVQAAIPKSWRHFLNSEYSQKTQGGLSLVAKIALCLMALPHNSNSACIDLGVRTHTKRCCRRNGMATRLLHLFVSTLYFAGGYLRDDGHLVTQGIGRAINWRFRARKDVASTKSKRMILR